jgi:hypothetical protein
MCNGGGVKHIRMKNTVILNKFLLLSGVLASSVFVVFTLLLGALGNDYNAVSQTVSEIGKAGSEFELLYKIMLSVVGVAMVLFSFGAWRCAAEVHLSILPALSLISYGLFTCGLALFPSPHSLHNVFGLLLLLGYVAPLLVWLSWKKAEDRTPSIVSGLVFLGLLVLIVLNLSPLFAPKLYPLDYYGVVQRLLIYTFYSWVGFLSVRMYRWKYSNECAVSTLMEA